MKNAVTKNYKSSYLQEIENARVEFFKRYSLHESLKRVVFFISIVVIIFCLLVLPSIWTNGGSSALAIEFGVPMIFLALILVYSIIVKSMINKKMSEFFTLYYKNTYKFALDNKGVSDVVLEEPGKISLEDLVESDMYKDLFEVGSRGLVTFKNSSIPCSIVDCAGQIKGEKRILPVFVGKYVRSTCSYKGKDSIIIYLRGEGKPLPPTNIDGKKVVLDNKKMVVYTNSKDWKKVLSGKVMKAIESIKTNDLLVDLAISLRNGKAYVAMGYDDPLMVPPLQNALDEKPVTQFKEDLVDVLTLLKELNQ